MNTIIAESVTPTDITLSWTALTDPIQTGGAPITFYNVEWLNPSSTLWESINTD